MKEINVIYSSDQNYKKYMGISLTSLLENSKQYFINVKIIGLGITDSVELKQLEERYSCSIEIVDFSNWLDRLNLKKNEWDISISAYARLFAGDMFPKLDRALYLDCDTIICGDVYPLFSIDLSDNYVAAVIDTASNDIKEKTGMDIKNPYVNAGVLLMNLAKWRRNQVSDKFLKYIAECDGRVFHHDQGVINHVFQGKISIVDPVYNSMTPYHTMKYDTMIKFYNVQKTYYCENEIVNARENPVILHYTEALATRPWYRKSTHPKRDKFEYYMKLSNWSDLEYVDDTRSLKMKLVSALYRNLPFGIASNLMKVLHNVNHIKDEE